MALKKACNLLQDGLTTSTPNGNMWVNEDMEVTIFSDSQVALKALKSVTIKSQLVNETVDCINILGANVKSLTLCWVRGHADHIGNKRADREARKGRDTHTSSTRFPQTTQGGSTL